MTALTLASAPRLPSRKPFDWWYYAKKRHALFPGISRAQFSADFLADHYARRSAEQPLWRKLGNALTYAGFRLWAPRRARQVARKYGLDAEWARQAAAIARETFTDPNDIALFRIERSEQMSDFIRRFEHSGVSKLINPVNWQVECVLSNKIDFYARCEQFGLPHPKVIAVTADGRPTALTVPPAGRYAAKPAGGEGGTGFRKIEPQADDVRDLASFTRFLQRTLGDTRHEWLVQEYVATHPALAGIALAALPTCRITTMVNESGGHEIVTSVLRFPSDPGSLVDNIKAGGLMAPIDLATGRLGTGCRGRGVGDFDRHPTSGALIEGTVLPMWEEAKSLALDAHARAFPEYNLVGWDVALTPDRPVLIEGNGKPCMIVAQRAPRRGIGATRFGELVRYHLERAAGRG